MNEQAQPVERLEQVEQPVEAVIVDTDPFGVGEEQDTPEGPVQGFQTQAASAPAPAQDPEPNPEFESDPRWDSLNPVPPRCFLLTGAAGSGKTTLARQFIENAGGGWRFAATTGIAAANLGPDVTTIHSLLRFGDFSSLAEQFSSGQLQRTLTRLRREEGLEGIVLEEVSMCSARMFDMLYQAMTWPEGAFEKPFWFGMLGDFCQLAPVPDRDNEALAINKKRNIVPGTDEYAFESPYWGQVAVQRLDKIWRQTNPKFLEGLNAARRGDGLGCVNALKEAGVQFLPELPQNFNGTTICATNDEVTAYNRNKLNEIRGKQIYQIAPQYWATPEYSAIMPSDWKIFRNSPFEFKEGALVMILINDTEDWNHVNGDLAVVRSWDSTLEQVEVELLNPRPGKDKVIQISWATRFIWLKRAPVFEGFDKDKAPRVSNERELHNYPTQPFYHIDKKRWCHGMLRYIPLRLAWATTCHKSQGLTLDRVLINPAAGFFGKPAMMYVALSRARTPEGLTIAGSPSLVASRVKVDPKVLRWV